MKQHDDRGVLHSSVITSTMGENNNMPIYEYKCQLCHNRTDKLLKEPKEVIKCPKCHNDAHRQFSVPAFNFTNGQGTSIGNLMSIPKHG